MSKTVILLLAVFVSGPAVADCTFGGPCGDGSYVGSLMGSRGGYRASSYGALPSFR
jgi:hypothetical protein